MSTDPASDISFRALFDAVNDAILIHDAESGAILDVNQRMCEMFGYTHDEVCRLSVEQLSVPSPEFSQAKALSLIQKAARGHPQVFEWHCVRKDGSRLWAEVSMRAANFGANQRVMVVTRDISERKATEQNARDNTYILEQAQRLSHLGSYVLNVDTGIWKSSEILDELFGIPPSHKKTVEGWLVLIHPDDRVAMQQYLQNIIQKRIPFDKEYRIVRLKDGLTRWVHGLGKLEFNERGDAQRMIGTIQDITERKSTEEALEKRVMALMHPELGSGILRFEDLFDIAEIQKIQDAFASATGVASIITDVDGRPITRPSNFCHLCEHIIRKTEKGLANCFRSDAALGRMNPSGPIVQPCLSGGLWDGGTSIYVGDRHIANWLIGQVLDDTRDSGNEHAMLNYAKEIGADEGKFRDALQKVTRMSREQFGKVCQALFLIAGQLSRMAIQNLRQANDIKERKISEAALIASERRYRELLENVHLFAVIMDIEGRVIFCNDHFLEVTGRTRAETMEKDWIELFIPAEQQKEVRSRFLEEVSQRNLSSHHEYPILTVQKSIRQVAWDYTPIHNSDGVVYGMAAIGVDLTEQINLEKQLLHSQKMEAIGLLAGGIAHDFNNILMVILGYCNLLQLKMEPTHPLRNNVDQITLSAERAALLTQSLLTFGRTQVINTRTVDLNEVVRNVEKFLGRSIGEDIDLNVRLSDGPLPLNADVGQMEQVLVNLATNARDAMPRGGTLTVCTGRVSVDAAFVQARCYGSPGEFVQITFEDTGLGMNPETLKKIFDPFFTTKERGKGTGLGLAIVYGIVKQHNGFIHCSSELGKGTIFTILLPASEEPIEARKERTPVSNLKRGSETILITEDDASVRDLLASILREHGYKVILASDGREAVELVRIHGPSLHLILMDIIMPKMSGKDAYHQIKKLCPELKVIFISGYTADVIRSRGDLDPGVKLIMKPVHPLELTRQVREVLDQEAADQ